MFKVIGDVKIKNRVKHEIYSIAQEAINNTLKHSVATLLEMILDQGNKELRLVISDKIVMDSKAVKTFGASIMRERACLIGASLNIESLPGAGTTTTLLYKNY